MQAAARVVGVDIAIVNARSEHDFDPAFDTIAQRRADALIVHIDALFQGRVGRIVVLAARHAVPAVYAWRGYVVAGGLMSYGTDIGPLQRQAGMNAAASSRGKSPPICRWCSRLGSNWSSI